MTKLLNLEGECLIIDARFADLEVGRLPRLVTRLIDRARLRFSIRKRRRCKTRKPEPADSRAYTTNGWL